MEFHKRYVFDGSVPMRYTEEDSGIDTDVTLLFEGVCAIAPSEERQGSEPELDETQLRQLAVQAVQPAYMCLCPDGLTGEMLNAAPAENIRAHAYASFKASLLPFHAVPEQLTLDAHRLTDRDAAVLESFKKRAALLDPAKAAQAMLSEQNRFLRGAMPPEQTDTVRWICACGSINTMHFCPDCGQKKSNRKWICACGSVNTMNFCPECGRKFE